MTAHCDDVCFHRLASLYDVAHSVGVVHNGPLTGTMGAQFQLRALAPSQIEVWPTCG